MDLFNSIICLVEQFLGALFGLLNSTLGELFGFTLTVPDLGCEETTT